MCIKNSPGWSHPIQNGISRNSPVLSIWHNFFFYWPAPVYPGSDHVHVHAKFGWVGFTNITNELLTNSISQIRHHIHVNFE